MIEVIVTYTCDRCGEARIGHLFDRTWIEIRRPGEPFGEENHFCNIRCLAEWAAEKQLSGDAA